MKRKALLFTALIALLALLTACGGSPPQTETAPQPAPATSAPEPASQPETATQSEEPPAPAATTQTEFPLPEDVTNPIDLGDGAINFQTTLSLPDVVSFYRFAFIGEGLVERELLTSVEETTFNLVFDGHASGKAIVVQGVDLGNGTVNVNLRFEDL
jgi:hypothetical protein